MLSNEVVVNSFFYGNTARNTNVTVTSSKIINYYTTLLHRVNGRLIFNETKYSASTSRIQGLIRRRLVGKDYVSVTNVPMGTESLERYVNAN